MTSQSKDYYLNIKMILDTLRNINLVKLYDSVIEDRYLKNIANYFIDSKEVDVLEIGYFLEELIINCLSI